MGVGCLLVFDWVLRMMMMHMLVSMRGVPHALVGMCLVVMVGVYVRYHDEDRYKRMMHRVKPVMHCITHRYLGLFYSPALVTLPLTLFKALELKDIALSAVVIVIGCLLTALWTSYSIQYVRRWTSQVVRKEQEELEKEEHSNIQFSDTVVLVWVSIAMVSTLVTMWCVGGGVEKTTSAAAERVSIVVAQLSVTICGYILGVRFLEPTSMIARWIQPMVFCAMVPNLWSVLMSHPVIGSRYSYEDWITLYLPPPGSGIGAGRILFVFLGPIITCFGFGIVEKWEIVLRHKMEIIVCCFASASFTLVSTGVLAGVVFHIDQRVARSLLSRGMTLALALENTKALGGVAEITAGAVAVTGLIGSNFIRLFLDAMGFSDVIVRGITASAVAHGLGAAVMGASEPEALPYAGLAYLMCGVSGILCTSLFSGFLLRLVT